MRKIIIDTDTGSDDAVALIMALRSQNIEVMAVTTVCGNVALAQATQNALMTIEVADAQKPPLYQGASKPLFRTLCTAPHVHGNDGMSDSDLIHPTLRPEPAGAVQAILDIVKANPHEIEIVTIGPVTNIALAIMTAPDIMRTVKKIYSMGTAGFGAGNVTPVAEFNVYVDAEAYHTMLSAGIPLTIIGFDICMGDAALTKKDIDSLWNSGAPAALFSMRCTKSLLQFTMERLGKQIIGLADAVAMGVVLWEDILLEAEPCYCYTCRFEEPSYGQVILYPCTAQTETNPPPDAADCKATVCKAIDTAAYKQRLFELLTA